MVPQELLQLVPQHLHLLQPRLRLAEGGRVPLLQLRQPALQHGPLLPGQAVAVLVQESLRRLRRQDDVLLLGQQLLVLGLKHADRQR